MTGRQPVAVYRVIDEAELLGESTHATDSGASWPAHHVDAGSLASSNESRSVRRSLRIADGHRRVMAVFISLSTFAIAGALSMSQPVTNRRRDAQAPRTAARVPFVHGRQVRYARPRSRALWDGSARHLRRDNRPSGSGETPSGSTVASVGVAVSAPIAASSRRSSGHSAQQAAQEFGFER